MWSQTKKKLSTDRSETRLSFFSRRSAHSFSVLALFPPGTKRYSLSVPLYLSHSSLPRVLSNTSQGLVQYPTIRHQLVISCGSLFFFLLLAKNCPSRLGISVRHQTLWEPLLVLALEYTIRSIIQSINQSKELFVCRLEIYSGEHQCAQQH